MGYKTEKKIPSIILSVFIVLLILVGTIVPAYSFSPDDLQQIVRLMANTTDRYIFSDTGDDALHEIVTKFPDMFVYSDEDRIALRSEWQHDDKKLPMAYFDFGYSAADIEQLCAAAKKHCTTQNEQLPSCANRVE